MALSLSKYARVEALGFASGQRHRVELAARSTVLARLRERFPAWAPRRFEDHLPGLRAARGWQGYTAVAADYGVPAPSSSR
ncbi:MAG TPA: hypothetical protein VES36_05240 [Candidatus Limnocylindrales bacterium]|nr:hypothetical protein [Candidatus Limnocylindrales bacterium]